MSAVTIKKIEPAFGDERGDISDLIEAEVHHTGLITSNEGAVRGNHYHKESTQYTYILTGQMEFRSKPADGSAQTESVIVEPGDMITIPPGIIHTLIALKHSTFLDCTTKSRLEDGYEEDTIRVDPI